MPWVSAHTKLQVLDIYTLHSTDATVGSFAKLKHLERLVVGDCELSATGWRRLSGLTRLKSLEVTFCEGAIVQDLELERFAHPTRGHPPYRRRRRDRLQGTGRPRSGVLRRRPHGYRPAGGLHPLRCPAARLAKSRRSSAR